MSKCIYHSLPSINEGRNRKDISKIIYDKLVISSYMKEYAKNKKFFIRTYGCQANIRDSEIIAGMLAESGFSSANNPNEADVIVINTCAVRENAEDKVYGEIGQLKNLKLKNKSIRIVLCGCMMQQEQVITFLTKTFPFIDVIMGTHNIDSLLNLIEESLIKNSRIIDVISKPGDIRENLPSVRNETFKAFVNIMYGCDKFCTYCIVPYTRGKQRSRELDDILNECKDLIQRGYQEITLLGQNVNAYGKDIKGVSFASLLEEVAKLGIPRLRFTTSHPWDFDEKTIDVIAKYPNIMKCIHLPVQSGNDTILKLMGRRYDSKQYKDLVDLIRCKIPDIAITTDIIVGFPNESYEQFKDTLEMVKYVKYDGAFTFIYSPRKGTPAANIKDDVPYEEKSRRFLELVKVLEDVISPISESMINKQYDVLVDSVSKKNESVLSGYTEKNKLINFVGDPSLIGKIVKVRITESHLYSMTGVLVHD